ncbi:MAG TPA: hypothetical protein VF864_16280 [Gemmatimonadales bacterium]
MPETTRPAFNAYALPLPRRRQGPAAALSLAVHLAIAILALWRGAELFEGGGGGGSGPRGGGGGGGRPALTWFALPTPSAPTAHELPPAPAVTVPTMAAPITEPVKLDVPPPVVAITPRPPAAVGTGEGTAGGPGEGPGTGGGKGTGTGPGVGADSGSGSGGAASDIFAATPLWAISPPPGAPREAHGKRHEVRFWVTAEGRVTRVEVTPPIKDSGYRREFTERMMGYLFKPATTRDGRHVDYIASVTVYP